MTRFRTCHTAISSADLADLFTDPPSELRTASIFRQTYRINSDYQRQLIHLGSIAIFTTTMSRRRGNNRERGFDMTSSNGRSVEEAIHNAEREKERIHRRHESSVMKEKETDAMRANTELRLQHEKAKKDIKDRDWKIVVLTDKCADGEKRAHLLQKAMVTIEARNRQIMELTGRCADWEKKAHLLQKAKEDVEDFYKMTENIQQSVEAKQKEDLQRLKEEHIQLQAALEDSQKMFGALEVKIQKELAETKERNLLELARRDEDCRRELTQQAERLQKELSDRDNILQQHLSERDETLLELQRLQEENTQLQELFKNKQKKKSFWSRVFRMKRKTPDPSKPSPVGGNPHSSPPA